VKVSETLSEWKGHKTVYSHCFISHGQVGPESKISKKNKHSHLDKKPIYTVVFFYKNHSIRTRASDLLKIKDILSLVLGKLRHIKKDKTIFVYK